MPQTMTKPRVMHFDLGAQNANRAADFYSKVFGWEFQKWQGPMDYWMIKTGEESEPGINGGLSEEAPGTTTITISVDDLDSYTMKVLESGGRIKMEKAAIPGIGWFAQFEDTEGNTLGLMQMDEQAM
jgi:uncharacterized protein